MVRPISEVRRPEIVQGAISAMNRHGLSVISYDLIAEESNMSRQLIRHYFPDAEQLMLGVCDALAAAHKEALATGVVNASATERLPLFLDLYFGVTGKNGVTKPHNEQAYDAMLSLATNSKAVRDNLRDQFKLLKDTVAHELRISKPELSQNACDELGHLFVSLMYGHWRMVASVGFSEQNHRVARAAMDRLIVSYCDSYDDPDLEPLETAQPINVEG